MSTIDNIFAIIDTQGIQQKDLTDYLGINKGVATQWRKGKSHSYNKYLSKIASFLNVPLSDLVCEDENEDIKKVTPAENGRDDISEDLQKLPVEDRQYVKGIIKGLLAKNGLDE